jgi:hypothetical protein
MPRARWTPALRSRKSAARRRRSKKERRAAAFEAFAADGIGDDVRHGNAKRFEAARSVGNRLATRPLAFCGVRARACRGSRSRRLVSRAYRVS